MLLDCTTIALLICGTFNLCRCCFHNNDGVTLEHHCICFLRSRLGTPVKLTRRNSFVVTTIVRRFQLKASILLESLRRGRSRRHEVVDVVLRVVGDPPDDGLQEHLLHRLRHQVSRLQGVAPLPALFQARRALLSR